VISNFEEKDFASVFVKSSNFIRLKIMFQWSNNPIDYADVRKCNTTSCESRWSRTYDEAVEMIKLGVKRIGTSKQKQEINTNGILILQ
jgi:deoxyribose-phosphate aldolase